MGTAANWGLTIEEKARARDAELVQLIPRLNAQERRYLARFHVLQNSEIGAPERNEYLRSCYRVRPAPSTWIDTLRTVGEPAAAACIAEALGPPVDCNVHRQAQEDRQFAFFDLPPALQPDQHRHVLKLGDNWRNLFDPISGERGDASQFFAARRIKWWHSRATGDPKALRGPTHNTLSSQVACVNVLLPLRYDGPALTAFMRSLDPEVDAVVPLLDGHVPANPSRVEFEWVAARGRQSLEGTPPTRGQRVTSADAFAVARLKNGALRGYLMEWKYVETGDEKDKNPGDDGKERRRRYAPLVHQVFKSTLQLEDLLFDPVYQLVRLILLARKIVDEQQLPNVTSVRTVLVCPRSNVVYRGTLPSGEIERRFGHATVAGAVRSALIDESAFIDAAPEELVAAVRQLGDPPSGRQAWLSYMGARYGW